MLWNTIIIGFICNNMSDQALLLYARMISSSSSLPDPYTYSSTLKACAETRQLRIGRAVHCHILRSRCVYPNPPSRIVCNSLLNMYVSCCSCYGSSSYDSLVCNVFDTIRKKQNVVAWNIIISWYVKRERFFEAFRHFVMLTKTGLKPTVVSFVNVFPAIRNVSDANVLYGMLIKMGSEYVNDMFAVSSAVFVYSELGELDSARKVFDQCLDRNTEVWNTMISGYVQNNRPLEALELFMEVAVKSEKHNVVMVDDVSFLSALTAASQLQQLNFAKRLHAYSIKNLSDLSTMILNAIVVMYSRCNSVQTSFKIFNIMRERDNVSWNTMISSLVQNGLDEEGLMLVHEMQKQGFVIDYVTITSLLSAASNLRNREAGKQTHGYLLRHEIQFEGMESYLIDMYSKSGLVEAARVLFETSCTHDRDLATWNAMIAGNTQNGLIEQAFNVFRQMLVQTVAPNAVTLASILPACNPLGSLALGKQLHAYAIRNCLNHNVFVDSALVDMYSKLGSIHYAEDVFANSPERNSVTYTNMILGYGQHGLGEKALSLFYSMREYDMSPDPITMVAVLSACSYTGLVDEGLRIFESMERDYGIHPSAEHYCCITDMLGRVGRVVEAYNFVKNLGEEGNVLGIWGSLIAACRTHGEFQLGKIVAKKFYEMEKLNNMSGYHVLLSNMYAEEGNWESVNRVREGMQDKGLSKDVGCSWIDVAGYINYFVSRDQKHPQSDNIYTSLEELGINMKDAGYRPCNEI